MNFKKNISLVGLVVVLTAVLALSSGCTKKVDVASNQINNNEDSIEATADINTIIKNQQAEDALVVANAEVNIDQELQDLETLLSQADADDFSEEGLSDVQ